ncbi:MAG TPA: winged helix-turn-helix domain-containing protein [Pyrinomonadaceae bacterium]|jgi:DNA-binding winged helix-turn-helix (wHTH) protein/Tfp pilus assembly protein PilF
MKKIYRFGKFTLNTGEQTLFAGESSVHLPTKEFEILRMLVENNGEILTKDEMMQAIWQDTFVEESNLAQYISRLRKILNAGGQQFIKTFSKRGYRFSAELVIDDPNLTLRRHISISVSESNRSPLKKIGEINNLAVLPFQSLRLQSDDDFLGIGITDALITQLTRTGQIIVRPTTAILRYANSAKTIIEIADELAVDAVLQGNLQRLGNRLRLTVQMFDARNETPIWAEVFNAEINDIFAVQDEIAEKIVDSLSRRLSAESRALLKNRYTENSDAYQEYLKGRFYQTKRDPQGLQKALIHFEKAIEIEPLYALAYSGIADVYETLPLMDEMAPTTAFPRAKSAILRALEIDPNLGEAHTSLGICLMNYDWNWQGAEISFRKAIELNPHYAVGHQVYATFLLRQGRIADALVELQKAQLLDPLSPVINTWLAEALTYLGEYEASILLHHETIKFSPDYFPAYYHLTFTYLLNNQLEHAVETSKKAMSFSENLSLTQFACVFLHAVLGETEKAQKILENLLEQRRTKYVSAVNIASCCAALEKFDETLYWLEIGIKERDPNLTWIKIDKEFTFIRKEEKFLNILSEIKLRG